MCCLAVSKILPAVFFFHITDFDFRSLHVKESKEAKKKQWFQQVFGIWFNDSKCH